MAGSQIDINDVCVALENDERGGAWLRGKNLTNGADGWFPRNHVLRVPEKTVATQLLRGVMLLIRAQVRGWKGGVGGGLTWGVGNGAGEGCSFPCVCLQPAENTVLVCGCPWLGKRNCSGHRQGQEVWPAVALS